MSEVVYTIRGTGNLSHLSDRKYSISEYDSAATVEDSLRVAVGVVEGAPLRMLKEVVVADASDDDEIRLSSISFQSLYLSTMKYLNTGETDHLSVPSRLLFISSEVPRAAAPSSKPTGQRQSSRRARTVTGRPSWQSLAKELICKYWPK